MDPGCRRIHPNQIQEEEGWIRAEDGWIHPNQIREEEGWIRAEDGWIRAEEGWAQREGWIQEKGWIRGRSAGGSGVGGVEGWFGGSHLTIRGWSHPPRHAVRVLGHARAPR